MKNKELQFDLLTVVVYTTNNYSAGGKVYTINWTIIIKLSKTCHIHMKWLKALSHYIRANCYYI